MIKQYLIDNVLKKNYSLAKHFYTKHLVTQIKEKEKFVFIYTMGKVGSTSIYDSLKNLSKDLYALHFHRLSEDYLSKREIQMKQSVFNKPNKSKHLYEGLLWKPQWVRNTFLNNEAFHINYITVIREPISRTISLFFQWLEFSEMDKTYKFKSRNPNFPFEIETPKTDLSKLYSYFLNQFDHYTHDYWLKEELEKNLGINVYKHPFNFEKQYCIFKTNKESLLILKLETMKDSYKTATLDFLGEAVALKKSNEAKNKDVSEVYKRFTQELPLSQDYIDKIYSSEYVRHFYSEEEITKFKNKWSRI